MNTYYFNDKEFQNSNLYASFMDKNPSFGTLRVRAYAANQAVPIEGLDVVVSTVFNNNKIIFFEGSTNDSGVIEGIVLPAPKLLSDDLVTPSKTTYDISAVYRDIKLFYQVNIYENVYVVQNISVVPDMNMQMGDNNGS